MCFSCRAPRFLPVLLVLTTLSWGQDAPPTRPAPPIIPEEVAPPVDAIPAGPQVRLRRIAIVRDGRSPYFEERVAEWKKELLSLAAGKYVVEYRDIDCGYNTERVRANLDDALKDPEVALVYAAGVMVSETAAKLPPEIRSKPVVSGALRFTDARALPISQRGTSTLPNYSFITEPNRATADLNLLKRLAKTSKLHVIADAAILVHIDQFAKVKTAVQEATGTALTMVTAGASASEALANVPKGARGVYVTLLPRMSEDERKKLYRGLAARGVVNLSMLGLPEVDRGAMASLRGDVTQTLARQTALNIHLLLTGSPATLLPVNLPVADRFRINGETARRMGWASDKETYLTVEWVNGDLEPPGTPIALEAALRGAARQNIEVLIAREQEAIAEQDVNVARSFLRPQVRARADLTGTGIHDPAGPGIPGISGIPSLTGNWVQSNRYGVELRQVLFNDELRSSAEATAVASEASRFETRSARLDAISQTADAYFAALAARKLVEIAKSDLRLSINNLQLAQLRTDTGAASPAEVHRWRQEEIRSRATLFQRDSDYRRAVTQFNRVSGNPRAGTWKFEDIVLGNDGFYFMDDLLRRVLKDTDDFRKFAFYLMFLAVENSPELDAFDKRIAAQGIILDQRKRAFYRPELSLVASADRVGNGTETTNDDAQTEGFLGFNISFPLTTGGQRTAEVARQSALVRQTTYRRENALQRIEQQILNAVNGIGFSHPNIRLTRDALVAARAQYDSVAELYAQGAATLVDLIEAQRALIFQEQEAAVAVYAYLSDIFALQRAIAWFQFERSAEDRARFARGLELFLRGGSITSAKGQLLQTGFEFNTVPLDSVRGAPKAQVVEERRRPVRSGPKLFRRR